MFFSAMALLGNCIPYWLISWGQKAIDSGLAAILMATMPVATLLLSHMLLQSERLTRHRLAGFSIAFLGVAVLIGPGAFFQTSGSPNAAFAQVAVLLAALCYAINTIIARVYSAQDALIAAAFTTFLATLVFLPVVGLDLKPIMVLDASSFASLLFLGVVATGLAPVIYFVLVNRAGPTFLSLINYLIPLWAVILGFLVFGEIPTWHVLIAAMLILGGIAVSQFAQRMDRVQIGGLSQGESKG